MADLSLQDLSEKMRHIDFTMLFTRAENGAAAGRPMSNNGDVDYQGDSFFFAYEQSSMVSDIERDSHVSMSLQGNKGLLGQPPLFIAIEAEAQVIRDKIAFEEHWQSDLDRWFPEGADTAGLVMLKVAAQRIHWWSGEDNGEIVVSEPTL
ncbi:MAG: pyridoxamine 5'-phosphate oxidase family protein [Steroidobacter sp.]